MAYDPKKHHRHSIRLVGRDYADAGMYFVTVCAAGHRCLFGQIEGEEMRVNAPGRIVEETWRGLPDHYPQVELDAFVIMPNHVHMIVALTDTARPNSVGAGLKPAPARRYGLPEIVRAFKTFSARRINERYSMGGTALWQRNYFEHVIRNETSLNRIRRYVVENPMRWAFDRENPAAVKPETDDPR